nr:MAG TPA: DNA polymerase III, alpha subunit [Caudoviricetes sp.]
MYSLHNHTAAGSNTRLLDSINKVEDLIQYAYDLGLEGIAITDHESVKAVPEAQKFYEAKKTKEPNSRWQDFKLIMGNEIYLCRNGLTSETYDSKKDKFYHFILLALDEVGHEQIRKLSTRAYGRSWMKMMRRVPTWYKDLEEIVKPNPGHIVASSACLGSWIDQTLLKNSQYEGRNEEAFEAGKARIEKWIYFIQSIFGKENFFLELQPSFNQEQVYVNNKLIELSRKYSIPAIVTTDSHYLRIEDRKIHKAYLNSKEGDREVDEFYATTYVMSEEEIHSYMDENLGREVVDEIISNTKLIGTRAKNWVLKKHFKLPYLPSQEDIELARNKSFDFPATVNLNWDIWNNFINSKEDSDKVFIKRIISRCNENPSFFWTKEKIDRMETELETVWNASVKQEMTWSKYFLQVADYIQIAWTAGDTLVGPGRGSGVGFYLNYLLDIIQIDPLCEKVKTLFWRLGSNGLLFIVI